MPTKLLPLPCEPFCLIFGVICGSIKQMEPLLWDISSLSRCSFLSKIDVYILANGEDEKLIETSAKNILHNISIHVWRAPHKKNIPLLIGQARSLLQKRLGLAMQREKRAIVWLLDDDMRIPAVAKSYLTWLPEIKKSGADIVIGCIDGGSPNPPAHGMTVQINDIIHNLEWLRTLPNEEILPDRSSENKKFREKYPDYYYDLSRLHHKHLDEAYWLVKEDDSETVATARRRMLNNVKRIFTGEAFLRPLIHEVPKNPITEAQPSCNRGGNCFVLNAKALTHTPNPTMESDIQNRRSDMLWALINRYYHNLHIVQINFPTYHHRFIGVTEKYNLEKNIGEIIGSSLYASLQEFFNSTPHASWNFSKNDREHILGRYHDYANRRIKQYEYNYYTLHNLLDRIKKDFAAVYPELFTFIQSAESWIDENNIIHIKNTCSGHNKTISEFLLSLPAQIENYSK